MFKIIIYFMVFNSASKSYYCFNCVSRTQDQIDNKDSKVDFYTAANCEKYPIALTRDLDKLLQFFEKPENNEVDGVKELIKIYNQAKEKKEQFQKEGKTKKHPFIALEGLSGSGKTTTASGLAKKINGSYIHSPSVSVEFLRNKFLNYTLLDNAYHHFSHFVSALEVEVLLHSTPVIMDRYWYSSASYYLARLIYGNPEKYSLPPKGDIIYTWPEGLLKPDIILYFEIDEPIRIQRITSRPPEDGKVERKVGRNELLLQSCPDYRNNVIQIVKNMEDPKVISINAALSVQEVLNQCYSKIKPLLKN